VAGYETKDATGEPYNQPGKLPLFSNFDPQTRHPVAKPPTILIDSEALDEAGQVNDEFKKVFAPEIQRFKAEYRALYPNRSVDRLEDEDLMREVLNTVGRKGLLGEHVRCVVSVSMLTEGWDANTVTHICGIRAFGSQLLCEQVAGRALRRVSYQTQPYLREPDGSAWQPIPPDDLPNYSAQEVVWKFAPEYAHIIGVPFNLFKGTTATVAPPQNKETHAILALPERAGYEITFPNIVAYRIEVTEGELTADFTHQEPYELDGTLVPTTTQMGNAFSPHIEELTIEAARHIRIQTLVYQITRYLLKHYFYDNDQDRQPRIQLFDSLKTIVEHWLSTQVRCLHNAFIGLLVYESEKKVADHIMQGIYAARQAEGREQIAPVFNFYNKFGSTKYVRGSTVRPVYPTRHSHVNLVVADTESWEQIAAKTLDELADEGMVASFAIPYAGLGDENPVWQSVEQGQRMADKFAERNMAENPLYFPDFIVRCRKPDGTVANLILEITGMNRNKTQKRWYVKHRWLPAVNSVRLQYGFEEWHFIEISNDIRDIANQLREAIQAF
jgi:type III restriction enzyme